MMAAEIAIYTLALEHCEMRVALQLAAAHSTASINPAQVEADQQGISPGSSLITPDKVTL